jgi:hypothetical protein
MSTEEAKMVSEIAKATGEVAKASGKAIDAASGFGVWLNRTIGTIPEDLIGILGGDWLHEQRKRTLHSLKAKTLEKCNKIQARPPSEPSISIVLPLLKAAVDENRPELQDLWAGLLASTFQPDGGQRVRRAFFDTLEKMEPSDARLFDAIVRAKLASPSGRVIPVDIGTEVGITGEDLVVSRNALDTLGLLEFGFEGARPTPYGIMFWRACNP